MSEAAPEPQTTVTEVAVTPATGNDDQAAEVEKWKALARKHEDRAKENANAAKELDKLRAAQMSETERAVAEAKAAGRAEALAESGKRLAAAEFRAAAAAAGLDVAAVIDLVDTARFITDTGEPDSKAITGAVEKFTALRGEQTPPRVSMDLGPRVVEQPKDTSPRGLIAAGLAEKSAT